MSTRWITEPPVANPLGDAASDRATTGAAWFLIGLLLVACGLMDALAATLVQQRIRAVDSRGNHVDVWRDEEGLPILHRCLASVLVGQLGAATAWVVLGRRNGVVRWLLLVASLLSFACLLTILHSPDGIQSPRAWQTRISFSDQPFQWIGFLTAYITCVGIGLLVARARGLDWALEATPENRSALLLHGFRLRLTPVRASSERRYRLRFSIGQLLQVTFFVAVIVGTQRWLPEGMFAAAWGHAIAFGMLTLAATSTVLGSRSTRCPLTVTVMLAVSIGFFHRPLAWIPQMTACLGVTFTVAVATWIGAQVGNHILAPCGETPRG